MTRDYRVACNRGTVKGVHALTPLTVPTTRLDALARCSKAACQGRKVTVSSQADADAPCACFHERTSSWLLDDFVGKRKQSGWHCQAECPGGGQIESQIEFRGLFDW